MALSESEVRNDKARTEAGIVAGNALNAAAQVHSGSGDDAVVLESAEMYYEFLMEKRDRVGTSPFLGSAAATPSPVDGPSVTSTKAVREVESAPTHEEAVVTVQAELDAEVASQSCPKCAGDMWDNRQRKADGSMSAKAPDWSCKDRACGGALGWPDDGKKKSTRKRSAPSKRAKEVAESV